MSVQPSKEPVNWGGLNHPEENHTRGRKRKEGSAVKEDPAIIRARKKAEKELNNNNAILADPARRKHASESIKMESKRDLQDKISVPKEIAPVSNQINEYSNNLFKRNIAVNRPAPESLQGRASN